MTTQKLEALVNELSQKTNLDRTTVLNFLIIFLENTLVQADLNVDTLVTQILETIRYDKELEMRVELEDKTKPETLNQYKV